MFLRMVSIRIRGEEAPRLKEIYGNPILEALGETQGCKFASLLQNIGDGDDCYSFTIWDSEADSLEYERGGKYQQLVELIRPLLLEAAEWSVQLSSDFTLEYAPVHEEPTISRFVDTTQPELIAHSHVVPYFVHRIMCTTSPEKCEEFRQLFRDQIFPFLRRLEGLVDVFLLQHSQRSHEFHVLTLWNAAVNESEIIPVRDYDRLTGLIMPLLPSFAQWKLRQDSGIGKAASSEDLVATQYRCLTARWFEGAERQ